MILYNYTNCDPYSPSTYGYGYGCQRRHQTGCGDVTGGRKQEMYTVFRRGCEIYETGSISCRITSFGINVLKFWVHAHNLNI